MERRGPQRPRKWERMMGKLALIFTAAMLFALSFAGNKAEALSPAGLRAAIERTQPVETVACRERRWGWHGWGWYPCGEQANTCQKCRMGWGGKYCWKVC